MSDLTKARLEARRQQIADIIGDGSTYANRFEMADAILALFPPVASAPAQVPADVQPVAWHLSTDKWDELSWGPFDPEKVTDGAVETPLYGPEALASEREAGRAEGIAQAAKRCDQYADQCDERRGRCVEAGNTPQAKTWAEQRNAAYTLAKKLRAQALCPTDLVTREEMEAAVAAEREACAATAANYIQGTADGLVAARQIARSIRARSGAQGGD